MYVPNHQKWLRYYEDISSHKHTSPFIGLNGTTDKSEGNIITLSNQYIIPIEKEKKIHINKDKADSSELTLISPTKQTVEQAVSAIERTEMKGIKTSKRGKKKRSVRRKVRRDRRKIGAKRGKQKRIRQNKRALKDIFV